MQPEWLEKAQAHERRFNWRMLLSMGLIVVGISNVLSDFGTLMLVLGGGGFVANQIHDNRFQAQNRKERRL